MTHHVRSARFLPKTKAVQKVGWSFALRTVVRWLNEAQNLRAADATGAPTQPVPPLDWLGVTMVAHSPSPPPPGEFTAPPCVALSAVVSGVPYGRAQEDLARHGLSFEDLRCCTCCRRWFLTASRKAQVCAACRPRRHPTAYRRQYRAALARRAEITPRVRAKRGPAKKDRTCKSDAPR